MIFSQSKLWAVRLKRTTMASLLLLGLATTGCQLHSDDPLNPEVEAFTVVERPAVACGPSTFKTLIESVGNSVGTVEFVNDAQFEYVILSCDHDWAVLNFQVYGGSIAGIPKNGTQLQHEAFPYKMSFAQPENQVSYKIPLGSLPACATFVVRAKVAKLDLFGNISMTKVVWMNGTNILNGYRGDFCRTICVAPPSSSTSTH
jgi:hypothetical protein